MSMINSQFSLDCYTKPHGP